jgi:hypothetical protein
MTDYSRMTTDDFQRILEEKVALLGTAELLAIPGIHEILSEELNNEILEQWEEENPEPDEEPDEEDDEDAETQEPPVTT